MTNEELYNDTLKDIMLKNFPKTKNWLKLTINSKNPNIDINALAEAMGYQVVPTDVGVEYKSKIIGKRIIVNSNIAEHVQRFEIANRIGQILVASETTNDSITTPAMPINTGKAQPLNKVVVDFLNSINFEPQKSDSLADTFQKLDELYKIYQYQATKPAIMQWYTTPNAEAQLANAYLNGFVLAK